MKLIKRFGLFAVVMGLLMSGTVICASADEAVPHSLPVTENISVEKNDSAAVSIGLNVIASQNDMAIAGIKGNALGFSADRFACAMNLSQVDSITVNELPDVTCGTLFIGSEGVSRGQRIKASDIALMTYEEADDGIGRDASFTFSVNDSAYEMTCHIYMVDKLNYSPTLSLASYAALNNETYRDVKISGVLSAYDPEGDELRYEIVKYPENGRIVLDNRSIGTYTYTPAAAFTGEDSFTYVVRDKYGNYSASAVVNLIVSAQDISTVYSDLIDDELYSHAISVTENGLMNGIQVGEHYYFEADREVTRGDFLVTAMNAVGIKNVPKTDKTVFSDDADINPEMKGYVALAYSKGYISGSVRDGKLCFAPDETIKLSEAAVIISNMIGYAEPKVTLTFADADAIPDWSGKAIESLHTLGILEAPEMISGANDVVTRGDMAKLLSKTMLVISR